MQTVGSRELKNRLGKYLQHVKKGRTIVITDRGKPFAKIVPAEDQAKHTPSIEDILLQLESEGHLKLATEPLRPRKPIYAKGKPASQMIIEDRR
ncbi:MAG TPA: type II toxin-antitoxin system prevent-host-death family antitoxin [Candidatus Acidoferrales bacterium]|nr:type II toxin-antitoxin system prevent-host-death family antitoxin [Candidatus Acidoferrales bacterium]